MLATVTPALMHRLTIRLAATAPDGAPHAFALTLAAYLAEQGAKLSWATALSEPWHLLAEIPMRDRIGRLTIRELDGGKGIAITLPAEAAYHPQPASILWLQPPIEKASKLPVLGLSLNSPETLSHGFIALAIQLAPLQSAYLERLSEGSSEKHVLARWHPSRTSDQAVGLYEVIAESFHEPCAIPPRENASPLCWFERLHSDPKPPPVESFEAWHQEAIAKLTATDRAPEDLASLLRRLSPDAPPFNFRPLAETALPPFMTPLHGTAALVLTPSPDGVTLAIDWTLPPETILTCALHGFAHLMLGHVRAGDEYGHWDTLETLSTPRPHRRWDHEVRQSFGHWLKPPPARQVESLNDCTPLEKAQLGLWRMIGEMLGERRQLHPEAERYQQAAYQRQAAQRLVAMLEEYGGGMLCDGVGLGKTYVATTLAVHYANTWRERLGNDPEAFLADPFRITILAPHSVVSTWQREAIPPLVAFGVPPGCIRVVSHAKLSRLTRTSELLERGTNGALSDLEHLMLSDLVIVDEAHNFRSLAARRTKVLRDLLRLQPRRDIRRRVALLTATPINNSLDDLRQEVGLLFSRPIWLSDAKTVEGYRRQSIAELAERCAKARKLKGNGDVAALVIHGQADARFSDAIDFRDDLDFGPNVQRIGDYIKEQDKKLKALQESIRLSAQEEMPQDLSEPVRIAEDLLDRIVVQRSRALCKDIERQQGSGIDLLFRPDAGLPEKLYYSDEYDGMADVLARFLPLFDTQDRRGSGLQPLSLKVYMWYDVREGIKNPDETSSVVGLQRVLVLKRLESSPVSFLITLLRLVVLHAHRLKELETLCLAVGDHDRYRELEAELASLLTKQPEGSLEKLQTLALKGRLGTSPQDILKYLGHAYLSTPTAQITEDAPLQLSLFGEVEEDSPKREHLDRLWELKEALLQDFTTLLEVTPELTDIVFGRFTRDEWPRGFIAGGEEVEWPRSAEWGLRLVRDAKLRRLVGRLIMARRCSQKVIVFSQFSDTLAYIQSVLRACRNFGRAEWQMVARGGLEVPQLRSEEVISLLDEIGCVTGSTEDREAIINAFAPFYRIGPFPPADSNQTSLVDAGNLDQEWEEAWREAILHPVHVLLASDVLAEGVNLQDAALLINFDVHWNPVRMIQRSGRIDRRLNPRIERTPEFPTLTALAASLGKSTPVYYWHSHPNEAPEVVNMILPDKLEAELQLRERIATKTLAIDFTLGLEQGTGAEADWMADYAFHGVSSLNAFQKDRAIERMAGHYERLTRAFVECGIRSEWSSGLNGWFRAEDGDSGSPLIGRAVLARHGGEPVVFTRSLKPRTIDKTPHWLWSPLKPGDSLLNFWLCLDAQTFPARTRQDLPWYPTASEPISPQHLLAAVEWLDNTTIRELAPQEVGRPLQQGVTALAAGFFGTEADRRAIQIHEFFILQGSLA